MSTSGGALPVETITAGSGITVTDPSGPDATVTAVSAQTISAALAADVALTAATQAVLITTASLAVGIWNVLWEATVENGGATAGTIEVAVVEGTGVTNGWYGAASGQAELPALTGGAASVGGGVTINVTTAGTFELVVTSSVAATAKALTPTTAYQAASGIACLRVT